MFPQSRIDPVLKIIDSLPVSVISSGHQNLQSRTRASKMVSPRSRPFRLVALVAVSFERQFKMGTKPMVFPLDAGGRVYVLHNENDEQLCAGSRETCYRLLELMLEVKRRADEIKSTTSANAEEVVRVAHAAVSSA
jgi:hypothetical protein